MNKRLLDKQTAVDSYSSILRERGLIVLLLFTFSLALWLLAFTAFKQIVISDAWEAFKLHSSLLNVGKALISGAAIGFALWYRLSIGWPMSMLCIAILLTLLLAPAVAMGRHQLQDIVTENPYFEMKDRSIQFFVYVSTQIVGIVFARKRVRPKN